MRSTHTHTHPFNGPLSRTTQVSKYQRGKTNLDFTEARDSGWQWHQLGRMQVCTSLQTDNHTSTPPLLCFLQAGCPSCRPTNSVKALKANPVRSKTAYIESCSGIEQKAIEAYPMNPYYLEAPVDKQIHRCKRKPHPRWRTCRLSHIFGYITHTRLKWYRHEGKRETE